MEIISYVLDGELAHKDSLGTGSVIRPGDIQVMSAGTGIRHSEFNHSSERPVHFLQIWLLPGREGLTPRYDQKEFSADDKRGRLRLVASRDGREGSLLIHQDADVFAALLAAGETVAHALAAGRKAWVHVVRGTVEVNGQSAQTGDGIALENETMLAVTAHADGSEVLVFDLP